MVTYMFKVRVRKVLENKGFQVINVENKSCPFEILSINKYGVVVAIKYLEHGRLTQKEESSLRSLRIPVRIAKEKYFGESKRLKFTKL